MSVESTGLDIKCLFFSDVASWRDGGGSSVSAGQEADGHPLQAKAFNVVPVRHDGGSSSDDEPSGGVSSFHSGSIPMQHLAQAQAAAAAAATMRPAMMRPGMMPPRLGPGPPPPGAGPMMFGPMMPPFVSQLFKLYYCMLY